MQVDETLVNAQLEAVPRVGSFTAGRLTGSDAEDFGGQADGAGVAQTLGAGTLDQIVAH